MIQELFIQNIALIDQLNISFIDGLNILTGETGAGKSIIVDSVSLILGSRADNELIKTGQSSAYVEALIVFDPGTFQTELENLGIDAADGQIVLSRELNITGKSTCRINGRPVTLSVLREVSKKLINLHGQNEHQVLLDASSHLELLDLYAIEEIKELKEGVRQSYKNYCKLESESRAFQVDEAEKQRTIDMLSFQIHEIESANLKSGEEETLKNERTLMLNAEKIAENLNLAKQYLFSGTPDAQDLISKAARSFHEISLMDERLAKLEQSSNEVYYILEDIVEELRKISEEIVFDEKRLEMIEDRLALISALRRKYGTSVEQILEYCSQAENKLDQITHSEEQAARYSELLEKAKNDLNLKCTLLTQKRKSCAARLEQLVVSQLKDLGMEHAIFEIRFDPISPGSSGADEVQFLLTVNKGEPLKPLAKVASGGEASRIMLALKSITAAKENVQTLIFDEIDTGISGKMAHVVAKKMALISKSRQVICVTHLPQIAAMGDLNYYIEKNIVQEKTQTIVKRLNPAQKVGEVARLSGGTASEAAIRHAEELIENANKVKDGLIITKKN